MTSLVSMAIFMIGFLVLGVNLKHVQIDGSANYSYANTRQSVRRVSTAAPRGSIYDRKGRILAGNRQSIAIALDPAQFQRRTWEQTEAAISNAVWQVAAVVGRPPQLTERQLKRHIRQSLAMPLIVWRDVDFGELSRFVEHERGFAGFGVENMEERIYPCGSVAAHLIGYVGRAEVERQSGDTKFNFANRELRGRSGLEHYYDSYLRGVGGEKNLVVDARGFAHGEMVIKEPRRGLDLKLNIDLDIQQLVEKELRGCTGACVVMDPRDGEVLAFASAPGYNLQEFVPVLSSELYDRLAGDRNKPLLNRASGGAYAPGSTFKPVTALAALNEGIPDNLTYECTGVYEIGDMHLRCARRWGHGPENLRTALRDSCNPYFCNLAMEAGTNALISAARAFGLGQKTGIDFGVDMAGVVPDDEWKRRQYGCAWYAGDLAQMSIGQSMLLVSPLQMARLAGAIGTGYLAVPRLKAGDHAELKPLPFSEEHLRAVREGMELVVSAGSARSGCEGVAVKVAGKTGTAEVGIGANRRKNTWFIAYAPADRPTVAIAMVIERGESGGSTTAPKVGNILKGIFNG